MSVATNRIGEVEGRALLEFRFSRTMEKMFRGLMGGVFVGMLWISSTGAAGLETDAPVGGDETATPLDEALEGHKAPSAPRAGEQRPPARQIEEIVVTAQKKEQTLQEVPISLSVVSGEFIKEQGISDFRELALYVPNTSVNPSSGQYNDVRIRGFGSPFANTKAFEQSVGLVIDGIPYTRLPYWQASVFDLERVEVLRGPQGTLFGKNTVAGLFNLVTKKPTDEYSGYIEGELGELDAHGIQGAVGGPVIPNLVNFRVAGLSDERDGFLENTTARVRAGLPERMNSRDRKAMRAQLGFPDIYGAGLVLSYETAQSETNGTGWEFRRVVPNHIPFFRFWDPNSDFSPGNWIGSTDQRDRTRAEINTFTANASYDLAGWGIDLVAGYSVLKWSLHLDEDFTPAPYFAIPLDADENPQTVVETRVNSPGLPGLLGLERIAGLGLGRSELVAGFFFDDRKVNDGVQFANLNAAVLGQFLATDASGIVPPCPDCESRAEEAASFYEQASNSLAGFGQLNWYLTDHWALEHGFRFTYESKEADWRGSCNTSSCAAFVAALNAESFTAHRSRSESAFTPKVTLRYDWTDEINFYAGWGKGFKTGGFNATVYNDNDPSGMVFGPEKGTSWELGTKMNLLDRAASLNLGIYRQTVSDLQVFVVTPDLNLTVVNAGESRAQGVEADLTWLPTSWLTLRGAMGLNDTKYLKFPDASCPFDRPNTDGDANPLCDLAGKPFEFTPRWTSMVTPSVRFPLSDIPLLGRLGPFAVGGVDLIASLNIEYADHYYADGTLDPRTRQSSFIRVGGNLGFGNVAQGWSLRVIGENLTNEVVAQHVRDVSIVGKSFAQTVDPPRLIRGQFRWEF